jgi:hypothetical protein
MVKYVKILLESQLDANWCVVWLQILSAFHPNVQFDSFSGPFGVARIANPFPAFVSAGAG